MADHPEILGLKEHQYSYVANVKMDEVKWEEYHAPIKQVKFVSGSQDRLLYEGLEDIPSRCL